MISMFFTNITASCFTLFRIVSHCFTCVIFFTIYSRFAPASWQKRDSKSVTAWRPGRADQSVSVNRFAVM